MRTTWWTGRSRDTDGRLTFLSQRHLVLTFFVFSKFLRGKQSCDANLASRAAQQPPGQRHISET